MVLTDRSSPRHRRAEVLHAVIEVADTRCDGRLPMDVAGVAETFADETDLFAALHLRWHTRLAGAIERELMAEPVDLADAVVTAWARTAEAHPGVRRIIDARLREPLDEPTRIALNRARIKEWVRLAIAAGLANDESPAAARAGRRLEARARDRQTATATAAPSDHRDAGQAPTLLARIRAVLAA